MRIQITKLAQIDLHSIEAYIQPENPYAAVSVIARILETIEFLADHPYMGRIGRVLHTREWVITGTPFIVVYQIRHKTILILRVLHAARKWP